MALMSELTLTNVDCRTEAGTVTWWSAPRAAGYPSQDALGVQFRPGGLPLLRLAVADGLTTCPRTPEVAGMDGARYAAHLAVAAVGAQGDVGYACAEVNRALRDVPASDGRPLRSRERPTTGLAVVDVPLDGGPVAVSSVYDCEVYVRTDGGWREVLRPDRAGEQAAAFLGERDRFRHGNPDATLADLMELDVELLADDPDRWGVVPLGALSEVYLRSTVLSRSGPDAVREVVVASDGAKLTPERLARHTVGDWLRGLRGWERGDAANLDQVKAHDDVSVVRLCLG
jgi:hypothetical protein